MSAVRDSVPTGQAASDAGLLAGRLRWIAGQAGDRPALVDDAGALTWSELDRRSTSTARALLQLGGCRPGDRVAIIGPNSVAYVAALLGILRAGCVMTPLSTLLSADALARILVDAGAAAVIAAPPVRALVKEAVGQMNGGRPRLIALDGEAPGWLSLAAMAAAADPALSLPDPGPEDDALIVYSSGTTGAPKGIVQTHALRALQTHNFAALGFTAQTTTLLSTPLCSNWTLTGLFPTLWAGGTAILASKFSPPRYLDLCRSHRPDILFLVPTQIERLLDAPAFEGFAAQAGGLKLCAGSPLAPERKLELVRRWPGGFIEIYGMTEGGVTTVLDVEGFPEKAASVGRPAEGIEVRIIDAKDRPLPVGAVGEIVGRSPNIMKGYHGRPDLTAALDWTDEAGRTFQRTGDLGRLDEEGFLYVVGRAKDMIISGGQNVYPIDIEEVLRTHPAVADVAVIGLPDLAWGEAPFAVVTPATPGVSAEAVRQWANGRLSKHQRLAGLAFVPELPRGSLDKVLKAELRERFAGWRSGAVPNAS